MMENLRAFVLSVTVVSLMGGTILCLVPQGRHRTYMKLLVGMLLMITVFSSWKGMGGDLLVDWSQWDLESGEALCAQGEEMADNAAVDIIKAECEAYILDKARRLAADIRIDLRVGEDLVPRSAQITGNLRPNQKEALEIILEEDLGIPKEAQHWSG